MSKKPDKPTRTPRERVMDKVEAMLAEHFGAAVVIVPDEVGDGGGLSVHWIGHQSHGRGLLSDAYDRVFDGDEGEDGPAAG